MFASVFTGIAIAASSGAEAPQPAATPPPPPPVAAAAPQGIERFGPEAFREVRPSTALDMVNHLPGFTFKNVDASVRGFAGAAGNVLIDGARPANKTDTLEQVLYRIPAAEVDHIDLIRGGAPGVDMQGQSVIANVVRRAKNGVSALTAAAVEVYPDGRAAPSARLEGARRWNGRTLEGSVRLARFIDNGEYPGRGVRYDETGALSRRTRLEARGGGSQLNGVAAFESPFYGGVLKLSANGERQTYDQDERDDLRPGPGRETLRYGEDKSGGEGSADWRATRPDGLGIEVLAIARRSAQQSRSRFEILDQAPAAIADFAQSDTYGETIARAKARKDLGPLVALEGSLEGVDNWLDTRARYAQDGVEIPLPAGRVRVEEKRGEAAASATWTFGPRLKLETGLRYEISEIASSGDVSRTRALGFLKPRLLASYTPDDRSQYRLRLEREVGQLNFRDFVASAAFATGSVQAGNPDLAPWSAWTVEISADRRIGDASFTLSVSHAEIADVIDRIPIVDANDPTAVYDAPGNIGEGRNSEVALDFTLPLGRFGLKRAELKGVGSWRRSEVSDPTTGERRRLSGQHPFDVQLTFSQDVPTLKTRWGATYAADGGETYWRFNEVDHYRRDRRIGLFADVQARADLAVRMELNGVGGRRFDRDIRLFQGLRDSSQLAFFDRRRQEGGPSVWVRVRRTLA